MASRVYNRTILIGRLGQNPQEHGNYVAFPILNTTVSDGKEQIQTHKIVVFGKQKEICMKHLSKGDLCCIEGKIDSETIEGKIDSETSAIVCERITFLSKHTSKEENANG